MKKTERILKDESVQVPETAIEMREIFRHFNLRH
jgi:hypothetical protein